MHYFQKNIGDYRRDTAHLSLTEHGVYQQLMDTYYLAEQPLTLDHADLMRTHCVRSADEVQAFENVLKDFFIRTDHGYIHKRCDIEIDAFHAKSKSASESAKARWERIRCERIANAMPPVSEMDANHKPLTINHKPKDQIPLSPSPKADAIPYSEIVNLYHETLPTLPHVQKLTAKRKGQIAARWRAGDLPDLETWKKYFGSICKSNFLMGKTDPVNGHKRFIADLEWITNESNFTKIWEGKYHGSV